MTRQFGVPGKLTCPVTRCGAVCGPKEIRRHINSKHPQVKLTSAQLASVDSLQCECGKVVSRTGKWALRSGRCAKLGVSAPETSFFY